MFTFSPCLLRRCHLGHAAIGGGEHDNIQHHRAGGQHKVGDAQHAEDALVDNRARRAVGAHVGQVGLVEHPDHGIL